MCGRLYVYAGNLMCGRWSVSGVGDGVTSGVLVVHSADQNRSRILSKKSFHHFIFLNLGFKKTASQSTAVIIFELKDSDLLTEILLDQRRKQQIEVELPE